MAPLVIDGPEWWARETPDKEAVWFEGDSLTYSELDAWADRAAAELRGRGVLPGDRVGIVAGNCIEYCVATLAMFKSGAVAVPMSTRMTARELAVLTASSEPKVVYTDEELRDKAEQAASQGAGFDLALLSGLTGMRDGPRTSFERPEVDPAEAAALIYTSGTTGEPKGVIFTNQTMLATLYEWGLTEPGFGHHQRMLWLLPLGGAPGMVWGIIHSFFRGGTFFLERQFNPAQAIESLQQHEITCVVGVPVLYEQMAAQPTFAAADFSHWDTAHVGGAPVSRKLLEAYQRKGVLLRQIYGMTEVGGSATVMPRSEALDLPEYCGQGNMFTKIRVVREDGTDCDPGEQGEILIKGPSVTPGYWRNEEATKAAIVEGWMHSGDIGELNQRGFLKVVDRKKDLIISGGLNISPAEIENTIAELPAIEEVAVIAAEDEKFGETPAAVVRVNGDFSVDTLVRHCNERLADYKVPRYVIVSDEPLPRMASGKVAKRVIREQHPDIPRSYEKVR